MFHYLNLFIMHAILQMRYNIKFFKNDLTKEFGSVRNRHDLDHFVCNFHAIHPYLIYVIECIRISDQERFSYKDIVTKVALVPC